MSTKLWVHKKTGNKYTILHFGVQEKTICPVVIYQQVGVVEAPVWVRPCKEFFDGRFKEFVG